MNKNIDLYDLKEIESILNLDKKITIEYLTSSNDFHISYEDGSRMKNNSYGLLCVLENIKDEQEEENNSKVKKTYIEEEQPEEEQQEEEPRISINSINQVDFLNNNGYEVICESPLEIYLFENEESFASMFFANIIYWSLWYDFLKNNNNRF